jgi:O-antigen/teichoic acid export membrane protein
MTSAPPSQLGRDILRFGTAIAITVALGAVQVFVIPHRLDMQTFGEYRIFLVYFPYFGLLHFGLADGAFLRWAGRTPGEIHREWRTTFGWLLGLESALLIVAVIAATKMSAILAATFIVSFVLCAMFANLSALAAYALQAGGDFSRAGIVAVAAPLSFVAIVLLVPMHTSTAVIGTYAISLGFSAVMGSVMVVMLRSNKNDSDFEKHHPLAPLALIRDGAHVLGANLAAGLAQSIDKIIVSFFVSLESYAQYGFASSVAVAGISATQTMQRVALSHAARRGGDDRAHFLGRFYDLTLVAYGVALVFVPMFERVVAHVLPIYVTALPIVRAFVIGAPFWIALHVVVVGTLQSHGLVRKQFAIELGGALVVLIVSAVCLALHTALWVIAAAGTVAAAATWGAGVMIVNRALPAAREQGAMRFLVMCLWQSAAIGVALAVSPRWELQTALYVAIAAVPTLRAVKRARTALP